MKFRIQRPDKWIADRPHLQADNILFYKNLAEVLKEDGHETIVVRHTYDNTSYPGYLNLGHHTRSLEPNVWNIKKGYIPYFMYFDRTGYSGWAEMAHNPALFEQAMQMDPALAKIGIDKLSRQLRRNQVSKWPQSKRIPNLPTPYVLVACQTPKDSVAHFAHIATIPLIKTVVNALRGTKYHVVVKAHPRATAVAKSVPVGTHVHVTDASIHNLIPKARAVFTVNSGVGFEALMYRRRVFTTGFSDYVQVTDRLFKPVTTSDIIDVMDTPVDRERINKFLFYMMNYYFVDARCKDSIRQRVNLALSEYLP